MENINRRAALKILSAAPVAAGFALTEAEAQQAHHLAETARQTAKQPGPDSNWQAGYRKGVEIARNMQQQRGYKVPGVGE